MTIGTMTKVRLDSSADDPKLARSELALNVDAYEATRTHLNSSTITSTPLTVGDGLESSGGTLRLRNGNSIIRSGVNGPPEINQPTRSIVAGDTIIATDRGKLLLCNGTFTLAITAAATLADGFKTAVRNVGVGTITIDPSGAEQIDGATTIALAAGESCEIGCSGTAFYTVGRVAIASLATSQYVAKVWARIDGIGTVALDDSYNCAGVIDNGIGDYTVTIDVDMATANYVAVATCSLEGGNRTVVTINDTDMLVGSCKVKSQDTVGSAPIDVDPLSLVIFGD